MIDEKSNEFELLNSGSLNLCAFRFSKEDIYSRRQISRKVGKKRKRQRKNKRGKKNKYNKKSESSYIPSENDKSKL